MEELIEKLISAGIEPQEAKKEISILLMELKDSEQIKKIISERIKTRIPIQYILGKAYFMDFEVKVDKNVLIPRPETEILVEETVRRLINSRDMPRHVPTALDIGTGSGIIAIALARLIPDIKIIAIDVNEDIINLARENAEKNNVSEKIKFEVCDVFSNGIEEILNRNNFDLIISNPPYVKSSEMKKLRPEVVLHEPKIALVGSKENNSGLIYYERIFELITAPRNDNKRLIALEIDPSLVNDLIKLLKSKGLNSFEIVKDYSKLDRCLFIFERSVKSGSLLPGY